MKSCHCWHAKYYFGATMNSWQLSISHMQSPLNEYQLQLINNKTNKTWRSWFGPIAWQIYRKAKSQVLKNHRFAVQNNSLLFDKHYAQHLMIEASLHHHFCHHLYQTTDDLRQQDMAQDLDAHDLLLYIRMTPQHPCHQTISRLASEKSKLGVDHKLIIDRLVARRLIQKIVINQQTFYDKNPHPHDHLFNTQTGQLTDYTEQKIHSDHPNLILVKPEQ